MKKETIKTLVIGLLAGIIIAGGTGTVIAYNINSNNVNFRSTDSAWKVNNVSDAIEDLYIKKTGNNYSTEERIVGTWIDGRPIYQKTISGYNSKLSWVSQNYTKTTISSPVDDVDVIVNARLLMSEKSEGSIDWSQNANIYIRSSDGDWVVCALEDYYMRVLTIQYTKTTDTVENNNQG